MSAPAGSPLPVDSPAEGPDRPKRSRRRRLLWPAVVTVVVLAAAVLTSFLWTSHYVHTATSDLQNQSSPSTTTSRGTSGGDQAALLAQAHGAVWAVSTLDGNGNPSVGTAFAVISTPSQTLLLTSYAVVAAASYQTPPPVTVHQGADAAQPVTVTTWDTVHDLALLVMNKGNEPVLHGTSGIPPVLGQQVYVVSGTGGLDGTIIPGKLIAVSDGALDQDNLPDDASRGGPLINTSGDALGVASSAYVPPESSDTPVAHSSVPIQEACSQVLVCPGGTFP